MKSVHVYPSTFEFESRILRITKALIERTRVSDIVIVAQAAPHLPSREALDARREVRRIAAKLRGDRFWSRVARFGEWSLRVSASLRGDKIDLVNCHSLSVLPLCVVLAIRHRAMLIYEPHELETETATFHGGRKRLAKLVERTLIRRARRVITVSDSIARHYRDEYRLEVLPDVVLNVPERPVRRPARSRVFHKQYGIPEDHLVFMYQGILDAMRGCRDLLDAFQGAAADKHIVFLGFGPMEAEIAEAAARHANIHYHPAVPPEEVMGLTAGADVGFALLDDSCLNHRYALPNKLFHYLHADLPVIVSDMPEMGGLVDLWHCGWRSANDAAALAARVGFVNRAARDEAAAGARECAAALNWENEADKLAGIYAELVGPQLA